MTKAAAARKIQKAYDLAMSAGKMGSKAEARAARRRVNELCKTYNLANPFKTPKPRAKKAAANEPSMGPVTSTMGDPFIDLFVSELQLLMNQAADALESAGIKLLIKY